MISQTARPRGPYPRLIRWKRWLFLLCVSLSSLKSAKAGRHAAVRPSEPAFGTQLISHEPSSPGTGSSQLPILGGSEASGPDAVLLSPLPALLEALNVMQLQFFEVWLGRWPTAIDWTAAVMGTQISASLNAISKSPDYDSAPNTMASAIPLGNVAVNENLINRYFTHLLSFYFAEDAFALRGQAYDDMLWVVLGWLEAIRLISAHSERHFNSSGAAERSDSWYAKQFMPSFAHRARIFYDLAAKGWDTSLCGGGMIWSPYLAPYKNAITNQLYIAASVGMYLHFPGDENRSPFVSDTEGSPTELPIPSKIHDPKYMEAAVQAHRWLAASNMTNSRGLYVDGFHIRGWRGGRTNGSTGSGQCDIRDEKVYTYNQGVLLSGLRGLWEATGTKSYLEDGHNLIRNVISATGWHSRDSEDRRRWAGIGRDGILEEACDPSGSCNQDGQTFKGIFFLHMSQFCTPLPVGSQNGVFFRADKELASLHHKSCETYGPWIKHNAQAAYGTRDLEGRYGMWWTPSLWQHDGPLDSEQLASPEEGTDYRNYGVPMDDVWRLLDESGRPSNGNIVTDQRPLPSTKRSTSWDPNNRGRGRTVETQSGGVAVQRAVYKMAEAEEE